MTTPTQNTPPQPISIWQPLEKNGKWVFRRPEPTAYGDHYAQCPEFALEKKAGQKRICFFGESVAAGHLYAPFLTPAKVLAHQLEMAQSPPFEVVDLARTNETTAPMVQTIKRSLQLDPDLWVIFAGNNWNLLEIPEASPYYPSKRWRKDIAEALRHGGLDGLLSWAAKALLTKVDRAFAQIHKLAQARGIAVVLVIPEVNLADWETLQPPALLGAKETRQWFLHFQAARTAMNREQWREAQKQALAMLKLDGGACPTPYRIIGMVQNKLGHEQNAHDAWRAEVDSSHYASLCFLGSPQCSSMFRNLQLKLAKRFGFEPVDLKPVFRQHSTTPVTDRRLFLDYCHLTREGMTVAMKAVTKTLFNLWQLPWQPPSLSLDAWCPAISGEADATAKLGAAVHCAHRLLPLRDKIEIVSYWCKEALKTSPGIRRNMMALIQARGQRLPALFSPAQERNHNSPYRLQIQHGWKYDHLDVSLIQGMIRAGKEFGYPFDDHFNRSLTEGQGLNEKPRDLLFPPTLLWEPLLRFYPQLMNQHQVHGWALYRSPWPRSQFALVCNGSDDLALDLTVRVPKQIGRRKLGLAINGEVFKFLFVGNPWANRNLVIPKDLLKQGLNCLSISWPLPRNGDFDPRDEAIAQLERGHETDFHWVFGELFSLQAWVIPS